MGRCRAAAGPRRYSQPEAVWGRVSMRLRIGAGAAVLALLVAACGNAGKPSGGGSGQTDGVSAHEIRVGGLASITGPLGDQYGRTACAGQRTTAGPIV